MSSSESVTFREKGNECYGSASKAGLSPCLQKSRLQDGRSWYEKAKSCTTDQDEICSASKNIAVVCKKIALLLTDRSNSSKERHF